MLILSRSVSHLNGARRISSSVIDILPEIRTWINAKKPVVALESTIITHGMPYPVNMQTTLACQDIIKEQGCMPAVIAVVGGRVKVGLTEDQLQYLAAAEGPTSAVKTSRRDFPYVIANKLDGGTTVSGTVVVANLVGIRVFATGGIGGVHRGGQNTMDISADLRELGRNPLMVVSSGVKSILDIGRTLEYLETEGVLVASYGDSKKMAAFYSRESSYECPVSVGSPEEAAALLDSLSRLGLQSGILLAVPIPHQHAMPYDIMERRIEEAVREAEEKHIVGKDMTPYLLQKINQLTHGSSLQSNVALIKNNAKVAAQIALAYSNMSMRDEVRRPSTLGYTSSEKNPVVVGGCVLDCNVTLHSPLNKIANPKTTGWTRTATGVTAK